MDTAWVTMFKAYLEIGVLGLCAVLTITIAFLYFKNGIKREQKQDQRIDKKGRTVSGRRHLPGSRSASAGRQHHHRRCQGDKSVHTGDL